MNDCIINRDRAAWVKANADIEHEHEFDIEGEGWKSERTRTYEGMTIRQQFVMAAMQGLCANPEYADGSYGNITAVDACAIADAALAAEARTRK